MVYRMYFLFLPKFEVLNQLADFYEIIQRLAPAAKCSDAGRLGLSLSCNQQRDQCSLLMVAMAGASLWQIFIA